MPADQAVITQIEWNYALVAPSWSAREGVFSAGFTCVVAGEAARELAPYYEAPGLCRGLQ